MSQHLMHLYTGNGKGKTTAAMGQALRMLGHGKPVFIAQFMKDGTSGELKSLKRFDLATVFEGAQLQGFFGNLTPQQQEEARQRHGEALEAMTEAVSRLRPALTVLDELCVALFMRLVRQEDALRLIKTALQHGDVVVTGRYAPDSLLEMADYVTRMEAVKHPFDTGTPAREGIEW
ncbi:MAG: cob(I)yrinic acid a,c-diamide adenosyltransferase [Christensenellales bacterium]|jgi:cob(I)alamin adenosyltransferase